MTNRLPILTSQLTALLQMIDAFPVVTLAQLLPDQPSHHHLHPLLPDDGILCLLQRLVVFVVDSVECWRHGWLLGQERGGLGGRHCGEAPRLEGAVSGGGFVKLYRNVSLVAVRGVRDVVVAGAGRMN